MQDALDSEYQRLKETRSFEPELSARLSSPLLLQVPHRWSSSQHRVLVVGQETLGWGFNSGRYYD